MQHSTDENERVGAASCGQRDRIAAPPPNVLSVAFRETDFAVSRKIHTARQSVYTTHNEYAAPEFSSLFRADFQVNPCGRRNPACPLDVSVYYFLSVCYKACLTKCKEAAILETSLSFVKA